jgi:ubiquinone/menaquinone biosynthesis C-methylase UbiE/predicted  nucleic acid-binding Zn-ribbon protein
MDKGRHQTLKPGRARDLYRRLPTYLYLADLLRGRRVLEVGSADGAAAFQLARAGALQVIGVERQPGLVEHAQARHRAQNLSFLQGDWSAIDLPDRSIDVALVPAGEDAFRIAGFLEEMRRVVARSGHLVVLCASGDRPGAVIGHSYHDLVARLGPVFGGVRMIGIMPFVGFSMVEFSEEDELSELELDTSLTALGNGRDPVCEYVALAGPIEGSARGYLAVELPASEGLAAVIAARGGGAGDEDARATLQSLETEAGDLRARLNASEEEVGRVTAHAARELDEERRSGDAARGRLASLETDLGVLRNERQQLVWRASHLEEKLQAREDELGAMRLESAPLEVIVKASEAHLQEMEASQEELAERDAYVEELQGELEEVSAAQGAAAQAAREAEMRAAALETDVRELRSRLARAEGLLLRGSTPPPAYSPGDPRLEELETGLTEKTKLAEKYQQNWKDAEAKTDELWRKIGDLQKELASNRDHGVETARAQRQAAQIALTRAVDEASRKMVSVQDQLNRTEKERAELERQLVDLRDRFAEETTASRTLAAAEITRLREEISQTRARLGQRAPTEIDQALRMLEQEMKEEEARIAEIERSLRGIAAAQG